MEPTATHLHAAAPGRVGNAAPDRPPAIVWGAFRGATACGPLWYRSYPGASTAHHQWPHARPPTCIRGGHPALTAALSGYCIHGGARGARALYASAPVYHLPGDTPALGGAGGAHPGPTH